MTAKEPRSVYATLNADGKISEIEDIVYSDSEAVGYGTTLECIPDSDGNTHYEYLKKAGVSA